MKLGQVGKIVYMYNGKEVTSYVERSSGRNIGYKTRKGLLKNIKHQINYFNSQGIPIISVEILDIEIKTTNVEVLSTGDL